MTLNVNNLPSQIRIGVVGENDARVVQIDWSAWAEQYGTGTVTVLLQRSGDTNPYPVVTFTDGTVTTWLPSSTDTAVAGLGKIQIEYRVNSVVAKTEIFRVQIAKSLTPETDPPDPYESWLDTLTDLASETEQNAQDAQAAQTAAEAAQDGAEAALAEFTSVTAEAETLPAGSEATATYQDGHLTFGIPRGETGTQGPKGDKGETGATGAQGPQGEQGPTGPKGDTGDTGPAGPTGADGFSPTATVTESDGDITITVTDKSGTTSATLHTDDALDEDSTNPVQNRAIVDALREMLPTDTASGSIASFPDGADGVPVKGLSVAVEPIQDLHGYDSPWPAGGGKNKFNIASGTARPLRGITPSYDNNGGLVFSGTVTEDGYYGSWSFEAVTLPAGTYTISIGEGVNRFQVVFLNDWVSAKSIMPGDTSRTFTATEPVTFNRVCISGENVIGETISVNVKKIQIESGSTATAYAPYSNICPISGRTQTVVTRTGANVLNLSEWEYESDSGITIGTDNISIINKGYQETLNRYNVLNRSACVFSFHVKTVALSDSRSSFAVYADGTTKLTGSGTGGTGNISLDSVGTEKDITLSVPNGTEYISFGGWAWSGAVEVTNLQLEPGSTATTYQSYNGQTITIQFGQTVYGGTVDVVNGVLTVDRAINVVDGTQALTGNGVQSYGGIQVRYIPSPAKKPAESVSVQNEGLVSDKFDTSSAYTDNPYTLTGRATNAYVYFNMPIGVTLTAEARTWFENNPTQLIYELAEPITIDLTPQQLTTLLGDNNVWADTGDTTVEYRADTQKYIQKMIASALA